MASKATKSLSAVELIARITADLAQLENIINADGVTGASEEAAEEFTFPTVKEVAKMKQPALLALGEKLTIDNVENLEEADLRELLTFVARFNEDASKLSKLELKALAEGLGVAFDKDLEVTRATITEYLGSPVTAEEATEEAAAEEVVEDAEVEETETEDAEPAPKPKNKKKAAPVEEEAAEEEAVEEEASETDADSDAADAEEDVAEAGDDAEVEADATEEGEAEEAVVENYVPTKADLATYNKFAPKKIETLGLLTKLLTGTDNVTYPMGVPYTRKEAAWESGFPLDDIAGSENGKSKVTGKVYGYDANDQFVEIKAKPAAKKPAGKK